MKKPPRGRLPGSYGIVTPPEGGPRLDILLKHVGMSRSEAHYRIMVDVKTLRHWSLGTPVPKTYLRRISHVLGIGESFLWKYLIGEIPIEDLPTSPHYWRRHMPKEWLRALAPLLWHPDTEGITKILNAVSQQILKKDSERRRT